jgi:hypothetical protein
LLLGAQLAVNIYVFYIFLGTNSHYFPKADSTNLWDTAVAVCPIALLSKEQQKRKIR